MQKSGNRPLSHFYLLPSETSTSGKVIPANLIRLHGNSLFVLFFFFSLQAFGICIPLKDPLLVHD